MTRYDLSCPYFLPEVMMKFTREARGNFETLKQTGIHVTECISGHKSTLTQSLLGTNNK